MKKRLRLIFCLLLAWALLTACGTSTQQEEEAFPEVTQYFGPATAEPTSTPTTEPVSTSDASTESIFSANPYDTPAENTETLDLTTALEFTEEDAMAEENVDLDTSSWSASGGAEITVTGTVYPYAGSTPIPLDPVDMPDKTLVPVNFTYTQYAIALGLSFEAPAGWVADESVSQTFILSEPESQMKDNQVGVITLSAVPVDETMSESALTTYVKSRLSDLSATNFSEWKESYTATRYLMGSLGVYANYSGTIVDGTEVGGRIHYVSFNNVLYGLEVLYPLAYSEEFLSVFSQIRTTLSAI